MKRTLLLIRFHKSYIFASHRVQSELVFNILSRTVCVLLKPREVKTGFFFFCRHGALNKSHQTLCLDEDKHFSYLPMKWNPRKKLWINNLLNLGGPRSARKKKLFLPNLSPVTPHRYFQYSGGIWHTICK